MAICYRHPNVETYRSCSRCDRPSCSDCLVDAPVGFQCVECVKAVTPPAAARMAQSVKAQKNLTLASMPITKLLIAINALIFVAGQTKASWATDEKLGVIAFLLNAPFREYYRLVTSGFLHFSILHVAFNMYALWGLGMNLEARLGPKRFVLLYFTAMLGGSAGAMILEPSGLTGGASGAVFGLFGALAVALQSRGISIMKTSLGPVLLINFVLTFAIKGISKGGHVGGFIFGALCGLITLRPKKKENEFLDLALMLGLCAVAVGAALFFAGRA
jgi:membrane associated rhomboid family serine protease